MKKNLLKLGAIVGLCLPAVASCGGPKPSTSSAGPSTSVEGSTSIGGSSSSTIGEDTSCTEAGQQGATIIRFWHALKNVNQQAIHDLTLQFNQLHRGSICVEMTAQNDYDTIFKNINNTITAQEDTFPDLATTYPDHVASYANSRAVIDMKQYRDDPTIGMTSEDWNDILPSYRAESVNYRFNTADVNAEEGKMYSLPLNKSTEIMYFNKTFFDYWTGKETVKMASGQTISQIQEGKDIGDNLAANTKDPVTAGQKEADAHNRGRYGPYIQMDGGEWKTPAEYGLKNPADIDPTDPTTWWTWDDVEKIGQIIQVITKTKADLTEPTLRTYNEVALANYSPNDPIDIKNTGNVTLSYDSPSNLFVTLANQANSYVRLENQTDGSFGPTYLFDEGDAADAYTQFDDLFEAGITTIPGAIGDGSLKYATNPFTSKYLFLSVGSVAGAALNSAGSFETGTAPIPQLDTKNSKVIQQGTNITMMNLKGADISLSNPGATSEAIVEKTKKTWEYVKFLTSKASNLYFATHTTYMPTRTSVINDPEYVAYLSADLAERKALQTSNKIATTNTLFTDPPFVGSGNVRSDAENVILDGLMGKQTSLRQEILNYAKKLRN